MRGIVSFGAYRPAVRVPVPGARVARVAASYDEDTTTMAVEACRVALAVAPEGAEVAALSFATTAPAYVEKANATAIHAALSLSEEILASDTAVSPRSTVAALRAALQGPAPVLVAAADMRVGLPGSVDEGGGTDAAAAVLAGDADADLILAEHLGSGSRTLEFLDRWRLPGEPHSRSWEERFGHEEFLRLVGPAFDAALVDAAIEAAEVGALLVTGANARAAKSARRALASRCGEVGEWTALGDAGAASGLLELCRCLEEVEAGTAIALVSLADGVDVDLFRARGPLARYLAARAPSPSPELAASYTDYLTWRGELGRERPRRPEPPRPAAPPSRRSVRWKFGLVGCECERCGRRYGPPQRRCVCGAVDEMRPIALRDVEGTVATFALDHLGATPQPPIIAAAVDLDGGGRMQCELADVAPADVAVGDRVAMTFRRLYTSDGVHNYFWKARPVAASTKVGGAR
jgi:3-hydroxy-3-methylglutaryl CoA synthase/uncharacterized OB-fold protein